MNFNEEHDAASALGEILTSAMMRAYEEPVPRRFFYAWERQGLRWLLRYLERNHGGSVGNDWMRSFLRLNREVILRDEGLIDFNLKAFREKGSDKS